MPTASTQAAPALEDYLGLFEALAAAGIEFVVIGEHAVAAYARLLGETVAPGELEVLVTRSALEILVADAGVVDARLRSRSAAGRLPTAALVWNDYPITLTTATDGMPTPDVVSRAAREFLLGSPDSIPVLLADPCDLLRNKLCANRPADKPQVSLLRRFLEEEAVLNFEREQEPRARIVPAERLLEVLETGTLDAGLAARLVPLARTPADFRFLAHRAPTPELVTQLLQHAPAEIRPIVEAIAKNRR